MHIFFSYRWVLQIPKPMTCRMIYWRQARKLEESDASCGQHLPSRFPRLARDAYLPTRNASSSPGQGRTVPLITSNAQPNSSLYQPGYTRSWSISCRNSFARRCGNDRDAWGTQPRCNRSTSTEETDVRSGIEMTMTREYRLSSFYNMMMMAHLRGFVLNIGASNANVIFWTIRA